MLLRKTSDYPKFIEVKNSPLKRTIHDCLDFGQLRGLDCSLMSMISQWYLEQVPNPIYYIIG